jgi:hypothetical protein
MAKLNNQSKRKKKHKNKRTPGLENSKSGKEMSATWKPATRKISHLETRNPENKQSGNQ